MRSLLPFFLPLDCFIIKLWIPVAVAGATREDTACWIINEHKECHPSCKTCKTCGNIASCTKCHRNYYKMSQSFFDEEFECWDKCDTIHKEIKFEEYRYCTPSNETVKRTSASSDLKNINNDSNWLFLCIIILTTVAINGGLIFVGFCFLKPCIKKIRENWLSRKTKNINVEMSLIKPNEQRREESNLPLNVNLDNSQQQNVYNHLRIINADEFIEGKMINHGNFSRVYEGKLGEQSVAMKVALKEGRKNIRKELQIYDKIFHPYILQAIGVHLGLENILFLPLRKFNLKEYLIDYGETERISLQILMVYCIQIVDAMKYLHKMDILHCDLKIENILIKDDNAKDVEISDFGCAVDLKHDHDARYIGTITHMSYELIRTTLNQEFHPRGTKSSDVWAFGITVWQIFSKAEKIPNDFLKLKDIAENYEKGKKLPMPKLMPERLWRYVLWECFDLEPQCRPSMEELYKKITTISHY